MPVLHFPAPSSVQVGPGFNRDYWARFEKFIKETAKASDGVYIVTGPLWLPQPDGRGTGKWEMKHPMIGEQCSNYQAMDFLAMLQYGFAHLVQAWKLRHSTRLLQLLHSSCLT